MSSLREVERMVSRTALANESAREASFDWRLVGMRTPILDAVKFGATNSVHDPLHDALHDAWRTGLVDDDDPPGCELPQDRKRVLAAHGANVENHLDGVSPVDERDDEPGAVVQG
jgi:hypothetical protein